MQWWAVVAAICACAASSANASSGTWQISSSNVTRPDELPAPNQELQKVWTIAGDGTLSRLHLHLSGRVFVDVEVAPPAPVPVGVNATQPANDSESDSSDSSDANARVVAKVILTGTSEQVLDQIEVVNDEKHASDSDDDDYDEDQDEDDDDSYHKSTTSGVKVHYKNERFDGAGFVLVQVVLVDKQALASLSIDSSVDVVVGRDVLLQNDQSKRLVLRSVGSGNFFVPTADQAYSVHQLRVIATGTTNLQLQAKALAVNDRFAMTVAGSGNVVVLADSVNVAGTLSTMVAGSGTVVVQGAKVVAQNLTTDVAGSGDVTYSTDGTCVNQEVGVAGSGTVEAGSITCVDTKVDVIGSGSVLIHTTHRLQTTTVLSGSIRYVGAKPQEIVSDGEFLLGGDPKGTVKPATANTYKNAEVLDIPVREAVHVELHLRRSWFGSEPRSHGWYRKGNKRVADNLLMATWLEQQERDNDSIRGVVIAVASVASVCAVTMVALKAYDVYVRRQYVLVR